jgi:hypothetical protein
MCVNEAQLVQMWWCAPRYEFAVVETPGLAGVVDDYLQRSGLALQEE